MKKPSHPAGIPQSDGTVIYSVPMAVKQLKRWHEPARYRIAAYVDVVAYKTRCEHIYIHPTVDNYQEYADYAYTVTHWPTGTALAHTQTMETARLVAAALGPILNWACYRRQHIQRQLKPVFLDWVLAIRSLPN